MKKFILLSLLTLSLSAKTITPNEVYTQAMLIQDHIHYLLKYYNIKHDHEGILKNVTVSTRLKPRNSWQKAYEILVKINMLRSSYNLSRVEPVGMEPVEHLNPAMVYGMTQRILAEIKIFEVRKGIDVPIFKFKNFIHKTPLDVYNSFFHISASFDELNRAELSPTYVFAETMRIYDDLTLVLHYLNISDNTIPSTRLVKVTVADSIKIAMKVLEKLQKLQRSVGIESSDFSSFVKEDATSSDVYTITGMILAELQPLKAYIGLSESITPPALRYGKKVPADIEQLMNWNLRKLALIKKLERR